MVAVTISLQWQCARLTLKKIVTATGRLWTESYIEFMKKGPMTLLCTPLAVLWWSFLIWLWLENVNNFHENSAPVCPWWKQAGPSSLPIRSTPAARFEILLHPRVACAQSSIKLQSLIRGKNLQSVAFLYKCRMVYLCLLIYQSIILP